MTVTDTINITRLEKQKRADESAEQLRHAATENFAANRARTAARREREHNRPNIIQQSSPSLGLEIKAINPSKTNCGYNPYFHEKHFKTAIYIQTIPTVASSK